MKNRKNTQKAKRVVTVGQILLTAQTLSVLSANSLGPQYREQAQKLIDSITRMQVSRDVAALFDEIDGNLKKTIHKMAADHETAQQATNTDEKPTGLYDVSYSPECESTVETSEGQSNDSVLGEV